MRGPWRHSIKAPLTCCAPEIGRSTVTIMRPALTLCAALSVTLGAHACAVNLAQVKAADVCFSTTEWIDRRKGSAADLSPLPMTPVYVATLKQLGFVPFSDFSGTCKYRLGTLLTLEQQGNMMLVRYEISLDTFGPAPQASNAWVAKFAFNATSNADSTKNIAAVMDAAFALLTADWKAAH